MNVQELNPKECSGFTAHWHTKVELLLVFWFCTVWLWYDLTTFCVVDFMWRHKWSLEYLVWWLEHVYMIVWLHMYVLACACVNSGPTAHFTHRQTSKAVWINPACRGHSACHPQFHISVAPAAPNLHAHSYWNEQMEFCYAPNHHPSLRKDKTSKEPRYICVCLHFARLCVITGEVEVLCVSVLSVGKVQVSCFSLLKQVICVSITALLQNLAPFLPD